MAIKKVTDTGEVIASPETCVVFFSNTTDGMVVHAEDGDHVPDNRRFGYLGEFNPSDFVDIDENFIVYLTEGPVERVYEAIELLEKITHLPHGEINGYSD